MGNPEFVIIGAGPAGLAAAYELAATQTSCVVLEQDVQVGGLSKTFTYKDYYFDIGGHRFFTKINEVNALWQKVLGDKFERRTRLSRIFYRGRFFAYPLRINDAMFGLGAWSGLKVMGSFLKARLFPSGVERTFEDWVSNRFGHELYTLFFKSYTEKVWGVPCTELSADWAAQRIRNLNLTRAVANAMGLVKGKDHATLTEVFDYPEYGPGQMYNAMADHISKQGGKVATQEKVRVLRHENSTIKGAATNSPDGMTDWESRHFISSMPVDELVRALSPEAPIQVRRAADKLRYRALITANLIIDQSFLAPDTWIYLHASEIKAGRMQIFKNWSEKMVPDPDRSSVSLEYFCEGSGGIWDLPDKDILAMATEDIERLGFCDKGKIVDGFVVRCEKAYPVYDLGYEKKMSVIRSYLESFLNLGCAGRAGQFRYNNMDHSVLTGMLAVRMLSGQQVNPWNVNNEGTYLEG